MLITDNDDPVGDSEQLREVAMNKRKVSLPFRAIDPARLDTDAAPPLFSGSRGHGVHDRTVLHPADER
jgi:hypothetical protein